MQYLFDAGGVLSYFQTAYGVEQMGGIPLYLLGDEYRKTGLFPEHLEINIDHLRNALRNRLVLQNDVMYGRDEREYDIGKHRFEHLFFRAEVIVQSGAVDAHADGDVAHTRFSVSFFNEHLFGSLYDPLLHTGIFCSSHDYYFEGY